MNKYLSTLGYQGPNILLILILLTLAKQGLASPFPYMIIIAWQILSHFLNVTIKNILRAPRPDSNKDPNFLQLKITLANFLTIHRQFGMPSGHAQATVSELIFIALYFKQPLLTAFAFLQTALTLWQRYQNRRHSAKQLAAGSALGLVVGLAFYKCFMLPSVDKYMVTTL